MSGLFYNLGRMLGPQVRKGKWIWKSLTAAEDEAIAAEYETGLDITARLRANLTINGDAGNILMLNSIAAKLSRRLANKSRKFSFYAYTDNSPNAFAVPGGFVFISSSLIDLYEGDADMTAFVAAHEMGHIVRKHAVNRLINAAAVSAVTKALPAKGGLAALLKSTGIKFFQSAYSQSQESEADIFGVKLMAAAGFKADKAIDALNKLAQSSAGKANAANEYFSTHPSIEARINHIRIGTRQNRQ